MIVIIALPSCGVKVKELPSIEFPYVSEIEFLKEVQNVSGKAKKKRFKDNRVISPFYFLLKVKELENDGIMKIAFYETGEITDDQKKRGQARKTEVERMRGWEDGKKRGQARKSMEDGKKRGQARKNEPVKVVSKQFRFGEQGKYYEYIVFFDRVEGLKPGIYRYAVFLTTV